MVIRRYRHWAATLFLAVVASSCDGFWPPDYAENPCLSETIEPDECGKGVCHVFIDKDKVCVDGLPKSCTALPRQEEQLSQELACEGLDNNCNDVVDEGCPCKKQEKQKCYPGTAEEARRGLCRKGIQTCDDEKLQWQLDCVGAILPATEECNDIYDNDCDGEVNEGCKCDEPGTTQHCYGGPAGTEGHGTCVWGEQICGSDGLWGACLGGQVPEEEVFDGKDNDCDDIIDPWTCHVGETEPCYTGNPDEIVVIDNVVPECKAGYRECVNGYWSDECKAQTLPKNESCNQKDDDCNHIVDDGVKQLEVCDGFDNDCDGVIDDDFPQKGQGCDTPLPGPCTPGTWSCPNGKLVCDPIYKKGVEKCDGIDNDCTGVIDDNDAAEPQDCTVSDQKGECRKGTTKCISGAVVCKKPENVPTDELCNQLDDDCDGDVDENNPQGGTSCDTKLLGICGDGVEACESGNLVCKPLLPPTVESCNGKDDNCNGNVDENNPGSNVDCIVPKLGECRFGKTECTDGALVCDQKVFPSNESCNNKDDDCDGAIDNGNPGGDKDCVVPGLVGECRFGKTNCGPGGIISCMQTVFVVGESCNNKDDDCDGTVDNGNPGGNVNCLTGKDGVCGPGKTLCSAGSVICESLNTPSVELCDGLDNDCDGTVDDNPQQVGTACNTGKPGPCAPGTYACTGGTLQCVSNVPPAPNEICDGVDNNCNGVVDDNAAQVGNACPTGLPGACGPGTMACVSGGLQCHQTTQSSNEVCDGVDNNCNGVADDNIAWVGDACTTGKLGACAPGTKACTNGALVCNQTTGSSSEVCDGFDNDCDGSVDENAAGNGDPCTTMFPGECKVGTKFCVNGAQSCVQSKQPAPEVCDGLDNDCNGLSDENNPGGNANCTVTTVLGECRNGKTTCLAGSITCTQVIQPLINEICNGKDDDCDGSVDENALQVGTPCTTNKPGECAAGTNQCISGVPTCTQNKWPSAEVCDGKDNDCNGQVDEGNPGAGSCSTNQPGICLPGTLLCTNGNSVCTPNTGPSVEVCNGLDDDCNGVIDNNVPGVGANCQTQLPGVCVQGKNACENGVLFCKPNTAPSQEICGDTIDQDCNGFPGELLLSENFSAPTLWSMSGGWQFGPASNNIYNDPTDDTTPFNTDRRLAGVWVNYYPNDNASGELTHTSINITPGARVHLQMQKWLDSDDTEMLHVLEVKDNLTQTWSVATSFTHDPSWKPFAVDLFPFIDPNATSFQFRLRFAVGNPLGNHGSMSIDDVKIYDDTCVPAP